MSARPRVALSARLRVAQPRRAVSSTLLAAAMAVGAILPAAAAAPSGGIAGAAHAAGPAAPHATPQALTPAGAGSLTRVISGLDQPLYVTNAGDDRLFVVERPGRIRVFRNLDSDATLESLGTFLDIRGIVRDSGSEQGLLGLAFHPDYTANGRFYVFYTDNSGASIVAEYRRDAKNSADSSSRRLVMKIPAADINHNGGWIAFGPDGLLYIAVGDGGGAGDQANNAQDKETRLGKILRIDPVDPDGAGPKKFRIPASNPFVDKPGRDEIWSFGLRNPWRNSFDPLTGDIWVADVGQYRFEEVNRDDDGRGLNYGWRRLEGRHLYPSGGVCQTNCKFLPIVEYKHNVSGADNCSVTGGYVSRRSGASLEGRYLYADLCSGRMWSISADHQFGDPIQLLASTGRTISSFGIGDDLRLYLVDYGGRVFRISGT